MDVGASVEQHGHEAELAAEDRSVKRRAAESVSETHEAGVRVEQRPDGLDVAPFGREVNRMIGRLRDDFPGRSRARSSICATCS